MTRARVVLLIVIGFVVIVGGSLLLIGALQGDETDQINPNPAPAVSTWSDR